MRGLGAALLVFGLVGGGPALAREWWESVPEPPERPLTAAPIPQSDPPAIAIPTGDALICGDPRLIGRTRPNIFGHLPGCGIFEPVELTEIAGIQMEGKVTLDCRTARTFANWLTGIAVPEARRTLGARIDRVWVVGSYVCRTRNHLPGARLSEHSVGRAVDVAGFFLGNGRRITLTDNWGKGTAGAFLHTVWEKACGPFNTVLGPDSDQFHKDHFHFDTAYRDSTYCR
ncbi:MAG: extensin family protein [Pseudomonadota bacterium]